MPRKAARLAEDALNREPAVALLVPRQVGKITVASAISNPRPDAIYLDLERPMDRARFARKHPRPVATTRETIFKSEQKRAAARDHADPPRGAPQHSARVSPQAPRDWRFPR